MGRFMVVEDHAFIARRLSAMFHGHGEVVVCGTLSEAFAHIADDFDGMIIDRGLPDGDGLDFALKVAEKKPSTPILLFTAADESESRRDTQRCGIVHADKVEGIALVRRMVASWVAGSDARIRGAPIEAERSTRSSRFVDRTAVRRAHVVALGERTSLVPDAPDTVIHVGLDPQHVRHPWVDACALPIDDANDATDEMCGRVRSIVAVVVRCPRVALAKGGVVARILHERPTTSVFVLDRDRSASVMAAVAGHGFVCLGGALTLEGELDELIADAQARLVASRLAFSLRALEWNLTPRERELTWLCTQVLPRERVQQLFGAKEPAFKGHLKRAMAKTGARTFGELGRIASS